MASPESMDCCASATRVLQIGSFARNYQCRAGIHHRHIAMRALCAFQHIEQGGCVGLRIAAAQIVWLAASKTHVLGRDLEDAHLSILQRRDAGAPAHGDFVKPVGAVHNPGAFRSEVF